MIVVRVVVLSFAVTKRAANSASVAEAMMLRRMTLIMCTAPFSVGLSVGALVGSSARSLS